MCTGPSTARWKNRRQPDSVVLTHPAIHHPPVIGKPSAKLFCLSDPWHLRAFGHCRRSLQNPGMDNLFSTIPFASPHEILYSLNLVKIHAGFPASNINTPGRQRAAAVRRRFAHLEVNSIGADVKPIRSIALNRGEETEGNGQRTQQGDLLHGRSKQYYDKKPF